MKEAAMTSVDAQDASRRMRTHWLSHIVHDMRGPLFAARGYTKLLLEEKAGEVTVNQRKYLITILENINKLAVSVDGLHEPPDHRDLHLEVLDLRELLESLVTPCREMPGVEIQEHILSAPAPTIGDRAKLIFAVHKLLGAVVEFSRSRCKIDLHARREEDEFLMRFTALADGPSGGAEPGQPPDLTEACEILRLHGGVACADTHHPGIFNITVRLPLIGQEADSPENMRQQQR